MYKMWVGLGWVGLWLIMHSIPSEDRSLALNHRAQQQGFALRRSDSSERSFPRLQILNGKEPYNKDGDAIAIDSLRKASPPTVFEVIK